MLSSWAQSKDPIPFKKMRFYPFGPEWLKGVKIESEDISNKGGDFVGIIAWLIIGLAAGWLASIVMKTDAEQGAVMDIVLGIIGAFVGGFIMNFIGKTGFTGFNMYSLLVATLGAIVIIFLGRKMRM